MEKKIDKLTKEELVTFVNSKYTEGLKLEEIAKGLEVGKTTLSNKLKTYGYAFKSGKYVEINKEHVANSVELDLHYLMLNAFDTQLSARINGQTKKDFEQLCAEKYPNVAVAKLVSLAIKEFTEKHK